MSLDATGRRQLGELMDSMATLGQDEPIQGSIRVALHTSGSGTIYWPEPPEPPLVLFMEVAQPLEPWERQAHRMRPDSDRDDWTGEPIE